MTDKNFQLILKFDVQVNDVNYCDDFWKSLVRVTIKIDKLSGTSYIKRLAFHSVLFNFLRCTGELSKMGLPKISKFLCCATLETGGLVIGWWDRLLLIWYWSNKKILTRFYAIISLLIILITISTVILSYFEYLQPDGTFDDFYQTVLVGKLEESETNVF